MNNSVEINNTKMEMNKFILIKRDRFPGQGDIRQFIKQYENAELVNNWDADKVKRLSVFFKDTASTLFRTFRK